MGWDGMGWDGMGWSERKGFSFGGKGLRGDGFGDDDR